MNAVFMCGTNMVIRKIALLEAGGMSENNVAEDFLTSLFIHERGWKSFYVPTVLAEGLAPEDFLSYYKQQYRWARGSLELLFKHNPLFRPGLTFSQKIQYLASASFYFSGFVVFLDLLLPIIYFFTGHVPLQLSSMALAAVFMPYIFLTVTLLRLSSNFSLTFRALSFSMGSWSIQMEAIFSALTGRKAKFDITAKKGLSGNFAYLTTPHIVYLLLTIIGAAMAVNREGLSTAFFNNLAWAIFNCVVFMMFISAAMPEKKRNDSAALRQTQAVAINITGFRKPESV
jgi:cellulose synthase (UDP-forming)